MKMGENGQNVRADATAGTSGDDGVVNALRDTVARFRSVIETAVDGIITIDHQGIIDFINPAGAQMFGYEPRELIGQNVSVLMPQPHASEHDGYMEAYLRTGRAKIIGIGRELFAKRRDGSLFPMRLAVSEMNLTGRRAFTGIVQDLSERRRLERQVLDAAAAEQRRIGQDLHDGMCQQLAALGTSIESLKRKSARGTPIDPEQLEAIGKLLRNSVGELRQVAHGLQPVNFRVGGLPVALQELARSTSDHFHVSCKSRCARDARVDDETTAEHLYRIAQEATGNAIRHGKARVVRIALTTPSSGGLWLGVLDDGVGFPDPLPPSAGMGLRIMKYRADAIGADLRISPRRRRRGAAVCCALPTSR
jgi:PAS domain S-box-containing protein